VSAEFRSVVVDGPVAIIEGRTALVLSRILAGSLRQRLTLRQLVAEMRLSPADQAAVLAAELALEDVGERWRIASLPQRGNAATGGNDEGVKEIGDRDTVTLINTASAARVAGRSERRIRQLAKAGDLPADKTAHGWMFRREDVIAYRDAA